MFTITTLNLETVWKNLDIKSDKAQAMGEVIKPIERITLMFKTMRVV